MVNLRKQLKEMEGSEETPSVVVTCVGGGGLAAGTVEVESAREWDGDERFCRSCVTF